MNENKQVNISQENLRDHTVNEVVDNNPGIMSNVDNFISKVSQKFIENKLHAFPRLCVETRRVNWLQKKQLKEQGNRKGWSKSKDFKWEYAIPTQLYLFMTNMVYVDFWNDANSKVWRSFMRGVCRGDDPEGLLRKVKTYYLNAERS